MNRTRIVAICIAATLAITGCGEPKTEVLEVAAPQQQVIVDNLPKRNILPLPAATTPVKPHTHPTRASRTRRVQSKPQTVTQSSKKLTGGGVWDRLAACESGGNWSINTGNGYYGGLQFSLSSWRAVGGSGLPSNASRAEQIQRGEALRAKQGWGAWPACSRKLGLR